VYGLPIQGTQCDTEFDVVPDDTFIYIASCVEELPTFPGLFSRIGLVGQDDHSGPSFCGLTSDVEGNQAAYICTLTVSVTRVFPTQVLLLQCAIILTSTSMRTISRPVCMCRCNARTRARSTHHCRRTWRKHWGLCPMDMPASPVDVNGYGTAGLASDQGNVLIVQQTNGNKQWRANELKRCTRY
jgi:hypothetical protein